MNTTELRVDEPFASRKINEKEVCSSESQTAGQLCNRKQFVFSPNGASAS